MAVQAPNASFHHTALGIKGDDLAKTKLAQPLVGIRQTSFEDGNEINTETDEGHTGVSNIDMGSYRTSAESGPNWEDGLRFAQGYEDYIYLLLGQDTVTPYNDGTSDIDGIYVHNFSQSAISNEELPFATIFHGFSKTATDGRIFNNAMLNEFEMSFSADDKPTVSPTFVADYNIVNTINPTRNFLDNHLARTVMAQHTKVYIGPVGATAQEMVSIDCFTEASWTVNNNAESQACHDDNFGENTKMMGAREVTGSITMPWHDATKYFETEYETYQKYGHIVSELITNKQVWYGTSGGNILIEDNQGAMVESGVPYQSMFKFPLVEVTNVTSTKSGNEAKDLTFEWKAIEQPNQSYMLAEMVTDLAACHIDDTGADREAYYPQVAPFV